MGPEICAVFLVQPHPLHIWVRALLEPARNLLPDALPASFCQPFQLRNGIHP
jgi:hypothetical protein